jgi:hypothetical protein
MEFELGSTVHSADGRKVGTIDRIIQEGSDGPVRGIVVHKGHFFTRDVLVPIEQVQRVDKDGIHLNLDEKYLDELPDFIESEYAHPLVDSQVPLGFTMGTVMFPNGVEPGVAPMIVEERKRVPLGDTDIGRGYTVRCKDSELGIVRDVLVDGTRDIVDSVVVEVADPPDVGTVRVPATLILDNDDEVITLDCTRQELDEILAKSK